MWFQLIFFFSDASKQRFVLFILYPPQSYDHPHTCVSTPWSYDGGWWSYNWGGGKSLNLFQSVSKGTSFCPPIVVQFFSPPQKKTICSKASPRVSNVLIFHFFLNHSRCFFFSSSPSQAIAQGIAYPPSHPAGQSLRGTMKSCSWEGWHLPGQTFMGTLANSTLW